MIISKKIISKCNLRVRDTKNKQVQKSQYLGSILTEDGEYNAEIKREHEKRIEHKLPEDSVWSSAKRLIKNANYRSGTPRSSMYRSLNTWGVS